MVWEQTRLFVLDLGLLDYSLRRSGHLISEWIRLYC